MIWNKRSDCYFCFEQRGFIDISKRTKIEKDKVEKCMDYGFLKNKKLTNKIFLKYKIKKIYMYICIYYILYIIYRRSRNVHMFYIL